MISMTWKARKKRKNNMVESSGSDIIIAKLKSSGKKISCYNIRT
jgi:hypothetical protein